MDVRHRASRISATTATAFAIGALAVDVAILVLPLRSGSSLLSSVLSDAYAFRVEIGLLLALFAQAVAILVAMVLLRRGQAPLASGVLVGVLVILGLRVVSSVLTSIDGWVWQSWVVLGLQTIECALLFLAARAAKQQAT